MGLTHIKDFTAEEVGIWLAAQGLGAYSEKFVSEGVDGDLLLSLSCDDFKSDLGLSSLHSKKVLKNIEFSKGLLEAAESGGGGGEEAEAARIKLEEEVEGLSGDKATLETKIYDLEDELKRKDEELMDLKAQLDRMQIESDKAMAESLAVVPDTEPIEVKAVPEPVSAPPPAPAPAPPPAPSTSKSRGHRQPGVVGGAARGAAGGALKGAIVGAILPGMDAGDGAAAGAAVGATSGGLRAIGGRRGRRFR